MHSKQRLIFALLTVCAVGLPLGSASADTSTQSAPLMPTKDPMAHQRAMQGYLVPKEGLSVGYNHGTMVPLMPTKDRLAHESSDMQLFPWSQQYRVTPSKTQGLIGVQSPLMPTKDPMAHQGSMQDDYLS
ncbi:MAG TPA: hypothetical protein VKA13_03905 [Gammaproteobacteria bacterium]|nr:hypothetical protein [Gammaproteobacteria bacterium]